MMSQADSDNQHALTSLAGVEARAAEWVMTRYDAGSWTKELGAEFDAWRAESSAHEVADFARVTPIVLQVMH